MAKPKPLPMEEIAEKYTAGRTFAQLALTYGVAPETIRRRLRQHGMQLRGTDAAVREARRNWATFEPPARRRPRRSSGPT
jgi:hypothetical protein